MDFNSAVEQISQKDLRYKPDSYEFICAALCFTQKKFKKEGHLSGRELLQGIREFAIEKYGPMAKAVLEYWGINKTGDFGNIVFNLIEKKVFFKTESDSIDDFKDVYDFDSAFGKFWDKIGKKGKAYKKADKKLA